MTDSTRAWRAAWLALAIVGMAILCWITLAAFLPGVLGWSAYNYVVDRVVEVSGWNRSLVRAIAILLLLPFMWAIGEVVRIGLMSRVRDAWHGRRSTAYRKLAAVSLLVAYVSGFFFVMYLAGGNFSMSGEALRYYAVTPEGIRLFDQPGHDPTYGIELKPITPDIAQSVERARRGLRPQPISRDRVPTLEFFDGNTGRSVVYVLQTADGTYDLFDSAGFHPTLGEPLRPVTSQIAQIIRQQVADAQADAERHTKTEAAAAAQRTRAEAAARLDAEQVARRQRYLGGRPPTGTWLAVSREGTFDARVASRLAPVFGGASVFADTFVADGVADRLERGETESLDDLNLAGAGRVVVVRVRSQTMKSVVGGASVLRTDVTLVARILRPTTGEVQIVEASGTGAGLDPASAEAQALDRAVDSLRSRLTSVSNVRLLLPQAAWFLERIASLATATRFASLEV